MCFDGLWDMDARVQGKEFYKGGKLKYDGQWKGPHKHGKGVKYDYAGNIERDGEWICDNFQGRGSEYYKNGQLKYQGINCNVFCSLKQTRYLESGSQGWQGQFLVREREPLLQRDLV